MAKGNKQAQMYTGKPSKASPSTEKFGGLVNGDSKTDAGNKRTPRLKGKSNG